MGACEGDGPEASSATDSAPPPSGQVPEPEPLKPGEGAFSQCEPGSGGGGYDIWIKSISCQETQSWLRRLLPTFNLPHGQGLGQLEGGWECISEQTGKGGMIYLRTCVRDEQLIVFKQSF